MTSISPIVAGGAFAAALAAAVASFVHLPVFMESRGKASDASDVSPAAKGRRLAAVGRAQWAFAALASAVIAAIMFLAHSAGTGWLRLLRIFIAALYLMSAAIFDFRSRLIPNFLTLAAFICGACLAAAEFLVPGSAAFAGLIVYTLGGALCFCVFYLMSRLTRGGLGMGDVKLIAVFAWLLGLEYALFSILFGLIVCAGTALVLLAGKKKRGTDHLPFGPFIFFGYIVALIMSFFKYLPGISG